jgi:tetratricopeptide (TPR) repeat protein
VAARKLSEAVAGLLRDGDSDWMSQRLRPLIGFAGDEGGRARDEAFPAWRRFFEAVAERNPTVLVFEDLHWADDALLAFVEELTELTFGVPLLVICTARPELLARRPAWGGGRANALTLSLPPLSEADTAALIHDLLQRSVMDEEQRRELIERAGGNPLYAEEFARMRADPATAGIGVPDTVQGIIAARIDALAPGHKRVLQDAAVVGKVFWEGAVAALGAADSADLEAALRELVRRELVRRERRSSVADETEYAFRHALVRDVAYGQIPRSERSQRHRAAAAWIASLGRPDDQAELLAHHHVQALEYARAAGLETDGLTAPAIAALRDAGERASALGAYQSASRYFDTALELAEPGGDEAGELLFLRGSAQFWWDGRGEESLREALALLEQRGLLEAAARASLLLGRAAWARGDRAEMDARVADVERLLAGLPDSMVRTESLVVRSGLHMVAGEFERAIELAQEGRGRLGEGERPDLRARSFDVMGCSRVSLGDEGGLEDQRRAIEIAREGRAIWEFHHATNNLAVSLLNLGRVREAGELNETWERGFSEIGGTAYSRQWFNSAQATEGFFSGRWDDTVAIVDSFLAALPEGDSHYLETDLRPLRATIAFAREDDAAARADLARAAEVASRSGGPQWATTALALGQMALSRGDAAEAANRVDEVLENPESVHGLLPDGLVPALAWLALDLDRRDRATAYLESAPRSGWVPIGQAILAGDAIAAAGLLEDAGHLPAAAYARLRAGGDQLPAALDFYRSVRATRYLREAEGPAAASG